MPKALGRALFYFCILSCVTVFNCKRLRASSYFGSYDVLQKNRDSFQIQTRFFGHFNREKNNSTPPESIALEMQYGRWWDRTAQLYVTLGYGVALSNSYNGGFGGRLALISFTGPSRGIIRALTVYMNAEGLIYRTRELLPVESFPQTSFIVRMGGGFLFSIGKSGLLDLNLLISRYSGNFFVGPSVGLGLLF